MAGLTAHPDGMSMVGAREMVARMSRMQPV
jgi:hypothetical protein